MTLRGATVALSTLFALSLASAADATVTFYTSQSAFSAAAPGVGFSGFNAGGSLVVNPNPLTVGGVTFSDNVTAADTATGGIPLLFTVPAASTPTYGVDFLAFQNTQVDINATLSGKFTAFGFNYGSYVSTGGPATITLSSGDSVTVTPGALQFLGFTSTTPISSITIDYPGGFSFDVISVSSVPEPAEWMLMLLGFGALGAAVRLRRKSATIAA
jgi:hypothetical protein